jgi:hypothetical protein
VCADSEPFQKGLRTKAPAFDSQSTAADNLLVTNLGANLWGHSQDDKTASIRAGYIHYQARCQSKHGCAQSAVIQIECRDGIGHPFLNRDHCEAHAQDVLKRAEDRRIPVSWP